MNPIAPYIVALHLQELRDEAEAHRRARLAQGTQPTTPAWRRGLGSGARGLSGLFASAARTLDPGVDGDRANRRSTNGRGARAMAA